jgi:lipopolysaccharide export system protein LptA
MLPQRKPAGTSPAAPQSAGRRGAPAPAPASDSQGHVPSILKQDQPVTITSNRLEYDGAAGHAVYSGNSRLWQGDTTKINGDTIIVDDKTGNLEARVNVRTEMTLDEVDPKTNARKATRSTGQSDAFAYDDAKRVATYTGNAHLLGSEGDVTAEKLDLFLVSGANELERAEGYGANGTVIVKEGDRVATGARLTYTTKDQTYLMTGTPVEAVEKTPQGCKKSVGAVLTFHRAVDTVKMAGTDLIRMVETQIACPAETR